MMENQIEELVYETPNVEIVEIEVEKGFAMSNMENLEEGEMGHW